MDFYAKVKKRCRYCKISHWYEISVEHKSKKFRDEQLEKNAKVYHAFTVLFECPNSDHEFTGVMRFPKEYKVKDVLAYPYAYKIRRARGSRKKITVAMKKRPRKKRFRVIHSHPQKNKKSR